MVPKEKGSDRIVARVRASSGGRSRGGGQRWAMAAVERRGGRFSRGPTFGFTPIRLFPTGDLDFRSFHSHPRRIRTARWVGPGAKGRRQVGPVRCGWCGKWGRVPTCGHALALVGAGKEGGGGCWGLSGFSWTPRGHARTAQPTPCFPAVSVRTRCGLGRPNADTEIWPSHHSFCGREPPGENPTSHRGHVRDRGVHVYVRASTYELWTWAAPIERKGGARVRMTGGASPDARHVVAAWIWRLFAVAVWLVSEPHHLDHKK